MASKNNRAKEVEDGKRMRLRRLEQKDAPLMLEWMHDQSMVKFMQADFENMTLQYCERFIASSQKDECNLHMAIADEDDTYMGTVSLKNINDKRAEFAIVVRKSATGKGYASYGMDEIISIGFNQLNLDYIYWYCKPVNLRAIHFYERKGYMRLDTAQQKQIQGGGTTIPFGQIVFGVSR